MEEMYELINFGSTIPLKLFLHRVGQVPRHWHEGIEILFILSGTVEIIVDDQIFNLSEDDLILINSNSIHQLLSEDCVIAALQVNLSKFDQELITADSLYFNCNSSLSTDKAPFRKIKILLAKMVKLNASSNAMNEILNKALAYELLYDLMSNFSAENTRTRMTSNQKNRERLSRIIDYISIHYREPIKLSDISELEFLSIPYLSKFFKETMDINFLSYVNSFRLSRAVNELLSSDLSIQQISDMNGFPNPHTFVTLFKKEYGILPSEYRKKIFDAHPSLSINNKSALVNYFSMTQSTYLKQLANYIDADDKSSSTVPNMRLHTGPTIIDTAKVIKKLVHTFKTFTTVGRAKEIMFSEVQEMLRQIQKDIGFKYIKFHGIFSDDMMVYSEDPLGNSIINFVYIDKIFDFLLSISLKPLIQLSFMPRQLAKYPEKKRFRSEFIISEPKDMSKWNHLVDSLTRHLIERYGMQEIKSWMFCVWNEPDTSPGLFGLDNDSAFFELYLNSYRTVKNVSSDLTFGSPSVIPLTEGSELWYEQFICFCRQNDCLPDFFNLHYYDADFSMLENQHWNINHTENARLNTDPGAFGNFIQHLRNNSTRFGLENKKIYLTEWNSTPSHRDLMSDTVFKSCYIAKNLLENYDKLDSFGFWTLTDLIEEHLIDKELFHGGMGLFTYNRIKKPVYHVFTLFNKLGDKLIDRGEGYFVTKSDRSIQICLYHYVHFSDLYASGEVFDLTFANRYTPFPDPVRKEFSLKLNSLDNGAYTIKEYTINRNYGSCFDKWIEMGAQPLTTNEDIEILNRLSYPMLFTQSVAVTDHTYTCTADLDPLEVRLIELIPKQSL